MPLTISDIISHKGKTPLVTVALYTYPMAKIFDPHVDIILVGDSLGMVLYGMDDTRGVTLEMMCEHGKAVTRARKNAYVVIDMPYGSYEETPLKAYQHAKQLLSETQADAVKLEGGVNMAETIRYLTENDISVVAHIGLLPQCAPDQGGFRTHGHDEAEYQAILADAKAVEQAGACAVVIEGVVEPLADEVTNILSIPTIGIGASVSCDGQVLVADDLLGMFTDYTPKFVKHYAELSGAIDEAAKHYASEVRSRHFPEKQHIRKRKQ